MKGIEKYNLDAIRALEALLKDETMVTKIRVLLGNSKYWYLTRIKPDSQRALKMGVQEVEEIYPGWWRYTF